jgi:hypothetical protein
MTWQLQFVRIKFLKWLLLIRNIQRGGSQIGPPQCLKVNAINIKVPSHFFLFSLPFVLFFLTLSCFAPIIYHGKYNNSHVRNIKRHIICQVTCTTGHITCHVSYYMPKTLEEILSFATKKSMTTNPKWLYIWL